MASDAVLVDRRGDGVAVVVLNRPAAMNALSRTLRRAFAAAMRDLAADAGVRAIVLTGAGDRAFCAGLDLKELGDDARTAVEGMGDDPDANPLAAMAGCGKPIVGAVNGAAITGGFEIALACDMLVAAPAARFADTHVRVGVLPGWGLSQRLSRRIGIARAREMALTGRFVDAETACRWGLVNRVVAADALLPEAIGLAAAIAAHPPAMVARYRALIDDGAALPLGAALALERDRARAHNAGLDSVTTARG